MLQFADLGHFLGPEPKLFLSVDFSLLVKKYNVPGPRYTSYPTVPHWKNDPLTSTEWVRAIQQEDHHNISLYIHLPLCEQLCTFCGCHKRITKNHQVKAPYIFTAAALLVILRGLNLGIPYLSPKVEKGSNHRNPSLKCCMKPPSISKKKADSAAFNFAK